MTIRPATNYEEDVILTLLVKHKSGLTRKEIQENTGIVVHKLTKVLRSLVRYRIVRTAPHHKGWHKYVLRKNSYIPQQIRECKNCRRDTVFWKPYKRNYWCRPCIIKDGVNFYDPHTP